MDVATETQRHREGEQWITLLFFLSFIPLCLCASVADSLFRFALLQQQIISLDDDPVTSVQAVDDLDAIAVLNSCLHLLLFIAIAFSNEDEALTVGFENGGLRN